MATCGPPAASLRRENTTQQANCSQPPAGREGAASLSTMCVRCIGVLCLCNEAFKNWCRVFAVPASTRCKGMAHHAGGWGCKAYPPLQQLRDRSGAFPLEKHFDGGPPIGSRRKVACMLARALPTTCSCPTVVAPAFAPFSPSRTTTGRLEPFGLALKLALKCTDPGWGARWSAQLPTGSAANWVCWQSAKTQTGILRQYFAPMAMR